MTDTHQVDRDSEESRAGCNPSLPNRPIGEVRRKDEVASLESAVSHTEINPDDDASPQEAYSMVAITKKLRTGIDHKYTNFANLLSSLYRDHDWKVDEARDSPTPLQFNTNTVTGLRSFKYPEISWMLTNPHSSVRGRHHSPQSLSAVRSLLSVIEVESEARESDASSQGNGGSKIHAESTEEDPRKKIPRSTRSETASQLAEGTIRALRDLELQEAIELHRSLRFWTSRWERPVLSWLEAGPTVWFSEGYNHQTVGQKVSQIQAVLARRVAAIGELQQHLLRAAWQKGVASWGVLGEGGQWTAVAGFDGRINEDYSERFDTQNTRRRLSEFEDMELASTLLPAIGLRRTESLKSVDPRDGFPHNYYGNAHVFVDGKHGGKIQTNDPAIAEWSVDAMKLVRKQLYYAGKGIMPLPYVDNWLDDAPNSYTDDRVKRLPKWAATIPATETSRSSLHSPFRCDQDISGGIEISDLSLMASEVSELLNAMEMILPKQSSRRLQRLKPTSRLRRNWYFFAAGAPVLSYLLFKLLRRGYGKELCQFIVQKVHMFTKEHVWGPLQSIFEELFSRKERESISDHAARVEVIESLKKMIRSWLDETFPEMGEREKSSRAERMDMSLIEQRKEENMKTIYEFNSVVRMSFIEMQFIKKEMMNALYAMDEMMMSNEINMNLAAVTPAVMMMYTMRYVARFLWYALLRVGKSREETYAQFRNILLNVERLLVMRNNPPSAPPPMDVGDIVEFSNGEQTNVLTADDLGMLMLHVHECRTILWSDAYRFSPQILRDVGEDLAELAGERGPVSVKQQLQIVSRMYRTHPFMKVVSTGIPFDLVYSGREV